MQCPTRLPVGYDTMHTESRVLFRDANQLEKQLMSFFPYDIQ